MSHWTEDGHPTPSSAALGAFEVSTDSALRSCLTARRLSSCADNLSTVPPAGPRHWKLGNHWYFYSADEPEFQEIDEKTKETVGKRVNWLEARNLCRRYCMDSISVETEREWQMVKRNISESKSRLC